MARRVELRLKFQNVKVPADINKYLSSLTFTDEDEDNADDLQLAFDDRERKWLGSWLEVKPTFIKTTTTVQKQVEAASVVNYVVKKGDTLWAIAKKYLGSGTKYPQIASENNIKNPNLIYPGQVFKITTGGTATQTVTETKETTKTTTASKNESTVQTAENQTTEAKQEQSCEFLISCKTVLSNKSALQSNYQVPAGGKIYEKKMEFEEGDTVMDVLKRTGVDIDISKGYVAGIDGLYEFDCGKNSGWMYRVNGKFPNYMAGKCKLHDGDKVEWLYTCVRGDL